MSNTFSPAGAGDALLAPLRVDDAGIALRVRRGLLTLGYNGDAVAAMMASHNESGFPPGAETALGCLVRAFVLRVATPEEVLRQKVGDDFFALCDGAGLWERVEGGVVGSVVIMVDNKTFLLSDHGDTRLGERAMYWVMGIGTSTMKLADSLARRPYGRVLDLCCGAGIQAVMAAPHAGEVVGVDRNVRALNLARFGAAMSKLNNLSFRESDCYSAVAGETFDAIVCNPPYVLTPDRQTYYRDGGMGGDRFAQKVLGEAPGYLNEGGVAHVMCDVAAMDGVTSDARLRGWLEGNGCDVLAFSGATRGVEAYARNWLREDGIHGDEERWIENLRDLGISRVTNYLVILRKRSGEGGNWFRVEAFDGDPKGHFGHQAARMMDGEDLARQDDAAIAAAKLRVPADVRLVHSMRDGGGKWVRDAARLEFVEGLARTFPIGAEEGENLLKLAPNATRQMLRWGVLEVVGR